MSGHRIPGPHRANFARRLVADREHKIHDGRRRFGELVPAFAAQSAGIEMRLFEQIERERMHRTFWETAGAVAFEAALGPVIDQRFGENAPRGIAGAKKQHIVDPLARHGSGGARPATRRPRAVWLTGHAQGLRASTMAEAM